MYSSELAKQITKKDIAYLTAGIEDNVQLVAVRFDKSPNKNRGFIEFKFEKEGKTLSHTEWEPKSEGKTPEELQATQTNQFSRIEQILKCFYPNPNDRLCLAENFEGFAKWVVEKLEAADKSILLRIKIVYNQNGYTTLPQYAKYTFIEPMSLVNENKSVIVKLGIDMFEKPIVADAEQPNANPLTIAETPANSVSDLPF